MSLAVLCSCTPPSGAGGGGGGLKEEERRALGLGSLAVPGAGPGFWVLLSLPLHLQLLSSSSPAPPGCLLTWLGSLVGFNNSV